MVVISEDVGRTSVEQVTKAFSPLLQLQTKADV